MGVTKNDTHNLSYHRIIKFYHFNQPFPRLFTLRLASFMIVYYYGNKSLNTSEELKK